MANKHLSATVLAALAVTLALLAGGGSALAQPPGIPYMGDFDLNHDATLSGQDLGVFFLYFEQYRDYDILNGAGDFNGDGRIDHLDALILFSEYLKPYSQTRVGSSAVKSAGVKPAAVAPASAAAPTNPASPAPISKSTPASP
jgi:hypothetical protein